MGDALDFSERALQLTRNAYGDAHLKTAWAMSQLAVHYSAVHRYPEARQLYEKLLENGIVAAATRLGLLGLR